MFFKYSALALLAFYGLVGLSQGQTECIPRSVLDLHLNNDGVLSWSINSTEVCEITNFVIHIWAIDGSEQYDLLVTDQKANVSFLSICSRYLFWVAAMSGSTQGVAQFLVTSMPLPPDSDLSISYISFLHNPNTSQTHVSWGMSNPEYNDCDLLYRVTVEQDGNPIIEDSYAYTNALILYSLAPCSTYQFGVRAINIGRPTIEGPLRLSFFDIGGQVQTPPTLLYVDAGARYANLSFVLNSKIRNPCEVTELYLNGGGFFERTIPIQDLDVFRQPVNVSLSALQPNSMYFFQASVKNSEGWSRPTVGAFQTLEEDAVLENSEPEA